jgi:hypothetical protein
MFSEYNQQDANFLNLLISVTRSTCFRRFFRPPSGAQNCTYSVRYLSEHYSHLLLAAGSILHFTEINKLGKVASCWLYSENLFPILISSWVMFIYSSNVCQKQCSQIRHIIIYWLNIYVHKKIPCKARKTWGKILKPHTVYKEISRGFVIICNYGKRIRILRDIFFNKTATLYSV